MQKVVTNHTHTERNSEILNIITKLQKNHFKRLMNGATKQRIVIVQKYRLKIRGTKVAI